MTNKIFDLKVRVVNFGRNLISFCNQIEKNEVTRPLITQLVKSGTSIGANYFEADNSESRQDFIHKINISRKEAAETKFFLQMIVEASPKQKTKARVLYKEANELHLIFNKISSKTKSNTKS